MQHMYTNGVKKARRLYFWAIAGLLACFLVASGPVALAANIEPTSADWSTFLSDSGHTGFNQNDTIINPQTASQLKLHWIVHAKGAITAQPVEANNVIYWGSWDGVEHATDVNGNELWATYIGKSHSCGSIIGVASTATIASIPVDGQATPVVFVGGGNASFYALNAATGKVVWTRALGTPPNNFIWSSPVVYKDNVYIGLASFGDCPAVQGKLIEMNAATGAIRHIFAVVPKGCIGGGQWSSPTIDTKTGNLYIATGSPDMCSTKETYVSAIVELRASDLSLVSSWQVPQSAWVVDPDFGATPTLFTGKIRGTVRALVGVAHKNGTFYAFLRDSLDQGPMWVAPLGSGGSDPEQGEGSISSGAWDGHRLYLGGGSTGIRGKHCRGGLRAISPSSGAFLWEDCLKDGPVIAAITGVPGVLAVEEGPVVMLVSTATGKTLFSYRDSSKGSIFYGAASISHGVLYVGNFDGNLYAFGP